MEIFISKHKELTRLIEAISGLLQGPEIEIDESSNDCYKITGKDDPGKIAVLCTIIEETADLYLGFGKTPDFYT